MCGYLSFSSLKLSTFKNSVFSHISHFSSLCWPGVATVLDSRDIAHFHVHSSGTALPTIGLDDLICMRQRKSCGKRGTESTRLRSAAQVIDHSWSPGERRVSVKKQKPCFHEGLQSTSCSALRLRQRSPRPEPRVGAFSYCTEQRGLALAPWGRVHDPVVLFENHGKQNYLCSHIPTKVLCGRVSGETPPFASYE